MKRKTLFLELLAMRLQYSMGWGRGTSALALACIAPALMAGCASHRQEPSPTTPSVANSAGSPNETSAPSTFQTPPAPQDNSAPPTSQSATTPGASPITGSLSRPAPSTNGVPAAQEPAPGDTVGDTTGQSAPADQTPAGVAAQSGVNLTDKQKQQLNNTERTAQQQLDTLKADTRLTNEQRMQKLALLQRQLQGRYNQILTPEQQQQLMSARQKQSVDAEINRWMNDVASTANLDPGQKAQIRTLVTAAVTRASAIGNNPSIPQAQRASQLRKIQSSTDASIKKILTPEQEKTMQQTQKQRTIEGIVHGPLQVLDETVGLTAEQRQQVKGILQQSAQQALALQQSSAGPDKRDAAYRSITESTEKQIRRILTPDQQAAWDQRQQEEARALQVDGPLNSIDAAVSLTAAQKARVQKLLEKAAQQTKAVGTDDSLSASDRIARLNKITQSTNAAIKQVLTASQRAKLNGGD